MQMIDNRDWRATHATAGSVTRSLGEDTHVALVVGRTHERARMVAISRRRKRMVAPSIADVPFLFAVMVRRRTFFQKDPSIMFLTLWLYIMPPDKVEVEPCFVVAALISRAQAQGVMRNGERTVKPNFPVPIRFRRFQEPTGDHLASSVSSGVTESQTRPATSVSLFPHASMPMSSTKTASPSMGCNCMCTACHDASTRKDCVRGVCEATDAVGLSS